MERYGWGIQPLDSLSDPHLNQSAYPLRRDTRERHLAIHHDNTNSDSNTNRYSDTYEHTHTDQHTDTYPDA